MKRPGKNPAESDFNRAALVMTAILFGCSALIAVLGLFAPSLCGLPSLPLPDVSRRLAKMAGHLTTSESCAYALHFQTLFVLACIQPLFFLRTWRGFAGGNPEALGRPVTLITSVLLVVGAVFLITQWPVAEVVVPDQKPDRYRFYYVWPQTPFLGWLIDVAVMAMLTWLAGFFLSAVFAQKAKLSKQQ